LLTGYIVIEIGRQYRFTKLTKWIGTIVAILVALACLFTTYPDYILPSGLSRSILLPYQTVSRLFWSFAIGWVLLLCSTNQGGIANRILSWPIWTPLARLNYSCYLVHATIIFISLYNQSMPVFYQGHLLVNSFVSQIFFSYVAAILVTIIFETPFFIFEKKIFNR
jgi:peptidoglycan/LPS O-acetylase OafA/YrhL